MNNLTKKLVSAAFALAIAVTPLAACSSGAPSDTPAEPSAAEATSASDIKTFSDLFALDPEMYMNGFSEDGSQFVFVCKAGDISMRAIAETTPEAKEQIDALDISDMDYLTQLGAILDTLPLVSMEDLSAGIIPQDELDAYVGKTYQDLLDAGFTFDHYFFYGGEQTGADLIYGDFDYTVTFDATISDDTDGGAALANATVVEISCAGPADSAIDPYLS